MATVRVPILYNGEWTQENCEYRFTGTQIWGIKVPHSTALEQFVISMKFKFKTSSEPLSPVEILNDCDAEFFFFKKLVAVSETLSASLMNVK